MIQKSKCLKRVLSTLAVVSAMTAFLSFPSHAQSTSKLTARLEKQNSELYADIQDTLSDNTDDLHLSFTDSNGSVKALIATTPAPEPTYSWSGSKLTRSAGVNYGPTGKETYYNLNMSGVVSIMRGMGFSSTDYPYWIRSDGAKMLGNYVMVAADLSVYRRGSTVPTSIGMGLVCDTGGFAASNPTQLDIATTW